VVVNYAENHEGAEMIDQIRVVLARHRPGYEVRSIAKLGEGCDNVVYEVNGELVIRGSKATDPARRTEGIGREMELLAVLPKLSTLPVPEPVFADLEAGMLAYRKLPGRPLNEHSVAEPARLAATVGKFVSRLHQAPLEQMEKLVSHDTERLTIWRQDAEQAYREVADQIPDAARRLIEEFLGRTPPAEPHAVAFCHNDLGAEHVLVDPEADTVTGVIDWTDAAIADPVHDFARLYRDLGPQFFDLMLTHYDGQCDDADRERAVFYARCELIEDIAYGSRTGARLYSEAALAHLDRTFA
jgi:aminoglycoside phosphotransferase (APT) family kinase protein